MDFKYNNVPIFKDVCNNCGRYGHNLHNCKMPITSFGVVLFRNNPKIGIEYLMICRKDTLGYIDFIRGKYQLINTNIEELYITGRSAICIKLQLSPCLQYVMNMLKQMTTNEKIKLQTKPFQDLWSELWGGNNANSIVCKKVQPQYKLEESLSRNKFNELKRNGTLNELIRISNNEYPKFDCPEFGFPKGRRSFNEKDFECAVRETIEETGYPENTFINIKNILPFEETFLGSNYKSYKHKYYLMYMKYEDSLSTENFEKSEVSNMVWNTYEECLECIRPYNIEKRRMITQINNTINLYKIRLR